MDRAVSDREKYVDKFCRCLDRDITELGKEVTEIKNLGQVCLQTGGISLVHISQFASRTALHGTPLLWTLWEPGEVSCIQWNPSNVDILGA